MLNLVLGGLVIAIVVLSLLYYFGSLAKWFSDYWTLKEDLEPAELFRHVTNSIPNKRLAGLILVLILTAVSLTLYQEYETRLAQEKDVVEHIPAPKGLDSKPVSEPPRKEEKRKPFEYKEFREDLM